MMMKRLRRSLYSSAVATVLLGGAHAASVDFEKQIWPTIENRCIRCHTAPYTDDKGRLKEPKADLRFDTPELIMKGSENGAVIVAGKPDDSPFYTLVILDPDDDDVMPSKGDPVTEAEAALIKTWIEEGAKFGDFKGSTTPRPPKVAKPKVLSTFERLSQGVDPAPEKDISLISESGGLVLVLAQNSNLLRVDYTQASEDVGDAHLKALSGIKGQLSELNLGGSNITDAGLKPLSSLAKLSRLHLENTAVGDAGIEGLKGLENLAYLNLYGTKVTDASIATLSGMASLKKLFVWQTDITDAGVAQLREARPELMVSRGWARDHRKVENEAIIAKFIKDKCCDAAHQKGWACTRTCCLKAVAAGNACEVCNVVEPVAPKPEAAKPAEPVAAKPDAVKPAEPVAAKPAEPKAADLSSQFTKDSCCDKAHKGGKACEHGCCVAAAAKNEICKKCNASDK